MRVGGCLCVRVLIGEEASGITWPSFIRFHQYIIRTRVNSSGQESVISFRKHVDAVLDLLPDKNSRPTLTRTQSTAGGNQ